MRLLICLAAALTLGACASAWNEQAAQECSERGFAADSVDYNMCVAISVNERRQRFATGLQAAGRAMSAASASNTPPPAGAALSAPQQCPVGSYWWTDSWGNRICRRFSDQSTATVQAPAGQQCPTGSYPWTDSWGNSICRSFNTPGQPSTDSYDTSRGCPVGFHESVDTWGNRVCQRN